MPAVKKPQSGAVILRSGSETGLVLKDA